MKKLWPSLGTLPTSLLFMLDKMKTKAWKRDWVRLWNVQFMATKVSQERDTPPLASQGSQAQSCCHYKLSWTFIFFPPVPAVSKWADAPPAGKSSRIQQVPSVWKRPSLKSQNTTSCQHTKRQLRFSLRSCLVCRSCDDFETFCSDFAE